jgi:tRNA pseudouridine55 synthase
MDAVLNLDKPRGMSSHQAVTRVKRFFRVSRAGHAGTLDPMATGVLLVCMGEATKLSRFLMELEKEYVAVMKFGERTDTYDAEGRVTERVDTPPFRREDVEDVLLSFRGEVVQVPPVYSAIKRDGIPLYKLARKGEAAKAPPRRVLIRDLRIERYGFPFLGIRVICSRGTYVRSLVDDIGRALGSAAHMTELERTRVGPFRVEQAASLERLADAGSAMASPAEALHHLPEVRLAAGDYRKAEDGRPVEAAPYGTFRPHEHLRLCGPDGRLLAVGRAVDGMLRVERKLLLKRKPEAHL